MRPGILYILTLISISAMMMASCSTAPQGETDGDASGSSTSPQTTREQTMQRSTMEPTKQRSMMEETTAMDTAVEETNMMEETTDEAVSEVVVVKMVGLTFRPAQIEVSPGTTVRWENEDRAEHNVVSEDENGPLESDTFRAGGSYEYTFEEPGEFSYLCTIHPFMKGVVTVR